MSSGNSFFVEWRTFADQLKLILILGCGPKNITGKFFNLGGRHGHPIFNQWRGEFD